MAAIIKRQFPAKSDRHYFHLGIVLEGHADSNINLAFSQDGSYLALKSQDKTFAYTVVNAMKKLKIVKRLKSGSKKENFRFPVSIAILPR